MFVIRSTLVFAQSDDDAIITGAGNLKYKTKKACQEISKHPN